MADFIVFDEQRWATGELIFDSSHVASTSDGFETAGLDSTIVVYPDNKTLEKISGATAKSGHSKNGHGAGAKRYAEFEVLVVGTGVYIGLGKSTVSKAANFTDSADGYGYYSADGNKRNNSIASAYGDSFTAGDTVNIAYDGDAGKIWFGKNGIWQNSGDPEAGTGEAYSGLSGTYHVFITFISTGTKGRFKGHEGEQVTAKPNQYAAWEQAGGGAGPEASTGGGLDFVEIDFVEVDYVGIDYAEVAYLAGDGAGGDVVDLVIARSGNNVVDRSANNVAVR